MKANVEGLGAVVAEDLPEAQWVDLRRQHAAVMRSLRRTWLFTCVDCGHPLFPKVSVLGNRFFAHRPDSPDTCPLKLTEGESAEHRRLKLAIYRAAKKVRGWDAELEAKAPEVDPLTGKPIIVDVVARRASDAPAAPVGTQPLQGWEVQLSAIDDGRVLDRQELRDRWLGRCTWVTEFRPSWAQRLPWYQVATAGPNVDLVVDGVVRWDTAAGDYMREDPFPGDAMVKYILRGARWAQDVGWELEFANTPTRRPRTARATLSRLNVRSAVAEYCDRLDAIPEAARSWTDVDWLRYARVALDRRNHGERLSALDRMAIARCPTEDLGDDLDELIAADGVPAFDPLTDEKPCIACGKVATTSASFDFPIHHHCAWHLASGDECGVAEHLGT